MSKLMALWLKILLKGWILMNEHVNGPMAQDLAEGVDSDEWVS